MVQQNKNLLVGNGPLLTLDEHMPFLENGAVYMQDGRILDVGEWKVLKEKYPQAPLLDAEGMLIMPGWINGHHHIYSAFARGMLQPGPAPRDFLSILEKVWWNIDRHLTLEQDYYSSVATFLECIRNGVTTVIDHHASYFAIEGSLDALAEGASLIGIRACLCYEISDRDGKEKALASVRENRRFLESLKTRDQTMLAGLMGMHASFTLPDWLLEYARQENTTGAGYHIHVAEGAYDQEHCLSHYGCTVVERLVKWGILGPDSLAGHGIHITAKDRALLMASGATLMHNPESNMGNAVGCAPVLEMVQQGVRVGLGTDGYTSDMFESWSLPKQPIFSKNTGGCQIVDFLRPWKCC